MKRFLPLLFLLSTVAQADVRQILHETGFSGGVCVIAGAKDADLALSLAGQGNFLIHCLAPDAVTCDALRKNIRASGRYGTVSAGVLSGHRLPHADNLVNLVVASGECGVTNDEIMRVLAPNGVAIIDGKKSVKAWPEEFDEWTHYLHGPDGNPVAQDRKVGPPRRLQWASAPRWCRSHEVDISIAAVVSARGRIFSIQDESPTGVHDTPLPPEERRFPDKWALVAQDAFNGVSLWKVPIPKWGSSVWEAGRIPFLATTQEEMWALPATLTRRLVATGDRVYVTLGYRAPVSELDAVTGKTLREFGDTVTTEEFVVCDGVLLARVCQIPDGKRPGPAAVAAAKGAGKGKKAAAAGAPARPFPEANVVAIELGSGKTLWNKPAGRMIPLTLAASAGAGCYLNDEGLTALDLRSGQERWQTPVPPRRGNDTQMGAALLIAQDKVLCVSNGPNAFALADGKALWSSDELVGPSFRGVPDLMVANDLAWVGTMTNTGLDLRTGAPARTIDVSGLFTGGHHPRCYRSKGTEDYLIWSKRGVEFMDIRTGRDHSGNDWCRTVCRSGFVPANGLLYVPPTPCRCQPGVQMTGFNAFAAAAPSGEQGAGKKARLERGPAYDSLRAPGSKRPASSDWPTYRRDNARSGRAGTKVPADLAQSWVTSLPGRITPPVIADGSLYVAGKDTHTVFCLDAATGEVRWSYTAGGLVDSPPTIDQGRVLFGCADGSVYCLDARDGAMDWRFEAAPREKTVVSYGQLESAWPVHGSVLVEGGVAYCSAGRSSFLDGGIDLFGLEVGSGKVLHQQHLDGPWSTPAEDRHPHAMEGTNSDILVGSGGKLFMLQCVFDLQLRKLDAPMLADSGVRKTERHLMATGGFLDDSGFDRLCWLNSEIWPGAQFATAAPRAGQLLVFDDSLTYALKYFNTQFSRSPHFTAGKEGYDLIADDNANEAIEATAGRARLFQRQKPARWQQKIPIRARAMLVAGEHLVLAGPPDVVPAADPYGSFEGRLGALLWVVSTKDGSKLSELKLPVPPVFDGMAAASGMLYLAMTDGRIFCLGEKR